MASIKPRPQKDGTINYLITVSLGRDKATGRQNLTYTTYTPKSKSPTKAEKEAQAYAIAFEEMAKNGDLVSGDKVTFSEFAAIWEKNWLPAKTKSVQEKYKDILRLRVLPAIGHMKITAVRAAHIDRIIKEQQETGNARAPKTVRDTFTVINSVLRYALKKQYIRENPCLRCDDLPPVTMRTGKELRFFDKDQARRFLREALVMEYEFHYGPRGRRSKKTGDAYTVKEYIHRHRVPLQWRVYFTMAVFSQFRRGEMCALTWNDIDEKKCRISVDKAAAMTRAEQYIKGPKTESGIRAISMPEELFGLLRAWKKEQTALCVKLGDAWKGHRNGLKEDGSPDTFDENNIFIQLDCGAPVHLSTPGHKFHEIIDLYNAACESEAEKAEDEAEKRKILDKRLPHIRLHDLRHTGATLLLGNGADIETVSHRLGHAKASVTLDIYGHSLPENDKQASDSLAAMLS